MKGLHMEIIIMALGADDAHIGLHIVPVLLFRKHCHLLLAVCDCQIQKL